MNIEESVRNYERKKRNEQVRKWCEKNRDKVRAYHKKWRDEHPEKIKAYREANREKIRERYRTNEGGFRDKQLACQRAWRLAQKERKENNG